MTPPSPARSWRPDRFDFRQHHLRQDRQGCFRRDVRHSGKDPAQIVEEKGLKQVTDTGAIEKIVDEVIAENPDNVAAYRSGKDKLFGFFVGQVMKKSQGKANPNIINDLLKKKLSP
jgi:Asp-tRNA(Asn)/Glu-tRNA(Gln) amidotransferase B subunit